MKMIGLLTFHSVNNYGASLQAYALQKKVEDLGHCCEYIDYKFFANAPAKITTMYKLKIKVNKLLFFKKTILSRKRSARFDDFRKNYLKISKTKYFGDEEITKCSEYDSYIVGSDQVWNFKITNSAKAYLLDFVPDDISKSSYASSFGVEILPGDQKEVFSKLINRFDYISVREKQGFNILNQLTDKEIDVCVDPTMLMSKNEWKKLAITPKEEEYILIYAMTDTPGLIKAAKSLAKKLNKKVVAIGLKKKYKDVKEIHTAGPLEWLGYFFKADAVVTNSFHGSSFSLIFNKPLYIEYLPDGWAVNSRLENIANTFKLQDRIITDGIIPDSGNIDYDSINAIMTKERNKSTEYLRKICSSAKGNLYEE